MTLKQKLDKIKSNIKSNAPIIITVASAATAVAAVVVAVQYRNKYNKAIEVDPKAWTSIEVPPSAWRDMEDGATLKVKLDGNNIYSTTLDDFPENI